MEQAGGLRYVPQASSLPKPKGQNLTEVGITPYLRAARADQVFDREGAKTQREKVESDLSKTLIIFINPEIFGNSRDFLLTLDHSGRSGTGRAR